MWTSSYFSNDFGADNLEPAFGFSPWGPWGRGSTVGNRDDQSMPLGVNATILEQAMDQIENSQVKANQNNPQVWCDNAMPKKTHGYNKVPEPSKYPNKYIAVITKFLRHLEGVGKIESWVSTRGSCHFNSVIAGDGNADSIGCQLQTRDDFFTMTRILNRANGQLTNEWSWFQLEIQHIRSFPQRKCSANKSMASRL